MPGGSSDCRRRALSRPALTERRACRGGREIGGRYPASSTRSIRYCADEPFDGPSRTSGSCSERCWRSETSSATNASRLTSSSDGAALGAGWPNWSVVAAPPPRSVGAASGRRSRSRYRGAVASATGLPRSSQFSSAGWPGLFRLGEFAGSGGSSLRVEARCFVLLQQRIALELGLHELHQLDDWRAAKGG